MSETNQRRVPGDVRMPSPNSPDDADHEHGHGHRHSAGSQGHAHRSGLWATVTHAFTPHSHDATDSIDSALESSARGVRAVKISLVGLGVTALLQLVIVCFSGSVALLADTIHNFSDALTAVPLWIAFVLGRRAATRRYTYGYGRAEDLAGLFVIAMIALSAVVAGWQAVDRLLNPAPVHNLGWVALAGFLGFLGNEAVAVFRIREGKAIGSAALVADGYHARTDGFTSLAVLAGAIGVWLGYPIFDPIIGLGIGVAILGIVWKTAKDMWHRMMDAVDPELYEEFKHIASHVNGVMDVHSTAIRWIGHRLWGEMHVTVNCKQSVLEGHFITEEVRHALFHKFPAMVEVIVHADPCECEKNIDYHPTSHHSFLPAADD